MENSLIFIGIETIPQNDFNTINQGLNFMYNRNYWLSRRFDDRKRFPYGFSRSGDFTIGQSDALEKYGHLLSALVSQQVVDPNNDDRAFLAALAEGETADNELARLWFKYTSIDRNIISAASSNKEYMDVKKDKDAVDVDLDVNDDWDEEEFA